MCTRHVLMNMFVCMYECIYSYNHILLCTLVCICMCLCTFTDPRNQLTSSSTVPLYLRSCPVVLERDASYSTANEIHHMRKTDRNANIKHEIKRAFEQNKVHHWSNLRVRLVVVTPGMGIRINRFSKLCPVNPKSINSRFWRTSNF